MSRAGKSLDAFIDKQTSAPHQGPVSAHKSWPQAARNDIAYVLHRNDAGTGRVSAAAMVRWLREKHGLSATRNHLDSYLLSIGRPRWWK